MENVVSRLSTARRKRETIPEPENSGNIPIRIPVRLICWETETLPEISPDTCGFIATSLRRPSISEYCVIAFRASEKARVQFHVLQRFMIFCISTMYHIHSSLHGSNFQVKMGKTRDKNNLGVSLTKTQGKFKQTRSQKARNNSAKALGPASVTDQNNIEEVMDKLNFVSLMACNQKPVEAIDEAAEDSDDYEDVSSDDESSDDNDVENESPVKLGDACLVLRRPDQVSCQKVLVSISL